MPELPEVETVKNFLAVKIRGKKIKAIKVLKPKVFIGDWQKAIGKTIEEVQRRAKVLFLKLSGGWWLMIHFKLTGQVVWIEKAKDEVVLGHPLPFAGTRLPAKTTHIIIDINGGKLFYNDLRQFGWMKLVEEKKALEEMKKFGPEPLTDDFDLEYLEKIVKKSKKPIKLLLMDQEKIAGLGNIYTNDALFEAGIAPFKPAFQLNKQEIKKLRQAIVKVLKEGIKYRGSSAADEAYVQPDGNKGGYQNHFKVYQRDGEKCLKCGNLIKRIKIGGRGTFYCPVCQK